MTTAGSITFRTTVLLLAVICLLCGLIDVWLASRFAATLGGYPVFEFFIGNETPAGIVVLRDLLQRSENSEAASLFFWLHAGADMILPLALVLLFRTSIRHLAGGGLMYGKPITPAILQGLLAVPVVYAVADLAENVAVLLYFAPSPPAWIASAAPDLLPWLARTKMALLLVSAILVLRFLMLRLLRPDAGDDRGV